MRATLRGLVFLACAIATTQFPTSSAPLSCITIRPAFVHVHPKKTPGGRGRIPPRLRMQDESSDDVRSRLENAFRVNLTGT
jgi:hypothetical protein